MTEENSFPLRINGTEQVTNGEEGHHWSVPSVPHLRELMRRVFALQDVAGEVGTRARQDMLTNFSPAVVGKQVAARIAAVQGLAQARAVKRRSKEEL
jgi:hypothetical protein